MGIRVLRALLSPAKASPPQMHQTPVRSTKQSVAACMDVHHAHYSANAHYAAAVRGRVAAGEYGADDALAVEVALEGQGLTLEEFGRVLRDKKANADTSAVYARYLWLSREIVHDGSCAKATQQ